MRKGWLLVTTWMACTAAAVGIAWFAVSAVLSGTSEQVGVKARPTATSHPATSSTVAAAAAGTQVLAASTVPAAPAPEGSTPTAPAESTAEPASTASGSETTEPPADTAVEPEPTTAPAPPVNGTFSTAGGVVTVSCSGATASLVSASPAQGYRVEVSDRGPAKVEVHFTSESHDSEVQVTCVDGRPVAEAVDD